MMAARSLALLAIGVVLAGCTDTPVPQDALASGSQAIEGLPSDGSIPAAGAGARPVWVHGDWWRYRIVFDPGLGEPLFDASDKIVVASLAGGDYNLASGGRDLAVIDAEFDSFFVGPMDKDLTGQHGFNSLPFQMFQWPLADGATWQTNFELTDPNGESVETTIPLTATAVPDVGGAAPGPGFRIQGSSPEGDTISYTYSPQVQWITEFTWANDAGATVMSMQLEEYGAGYEGTFIQVTLDPLYERAAIVPFFVFDPTTAPTPDVVAIGEATFILRVVALFTFGAQLDPAAPALPGAGAVTVNIVPPDGTPQTFTHQGTSDSFAVDILTTEDFTPGNYAVTYAMAGTGVGAFVLIHAFQETVTEFTAATHETHGG